MKMEAVGFVRKLVNFYHTTMRHISAVNTPYCTIFKITLKAYLILFYFFHGRFLLILVWLEKVKILKLLTKESCLFFLSVI